MPPQRDATLSIIFERAPTNVYYTVQIVNNRELFAAGIGNIPIPRIKLQSGRAGLFMSKVKVSFLHRP